MAKTMISITEIAKQLEALMERGVVAIKQSFEDEGVILSDVFTMRRITEPIGTNVYVKIGGCEAITDINNCLSNNQEHIMCVDYVSILRHILNIFEIKSSRKMSLFGIIMWGGT
mgnify:CR=1 FL=1